MGRLRRRESARVRQDHDTFRFRVGHLYGAVRPRDAEAVGAIRVARRPLEIANSTDDVFCVPMGATLVVLHHTMNTSEEEWGDDALEFRPGRAQAKTATFSHGIHRCPGEKTAAIMIQSLVHLLLVRSLELTEPLSPLCFERATLSQRRGAVQGFFPRRNGEQEHATTFTNSK